MSATPFGENLRREREMRGVSLEEISKATRISIRSLQALEREQWNRLPGGIFNRGFIRAIARFLGLNEEDLIAEYALAIDEQRETAIAPVEAKPRRRWGAVALVAVIAALAGAGWFAYRHYARPAKAGHPPVAEDAAAPAPARPVTRRPAPVKPAASVVRPERSAAAAPVTQTPAQEHADASAATMPEALELNVQAGKSAQVKIVADGKTVFSGELSPDHAEHFQAQDSFLIFSSEANALLLELNGQIQPPFGTPGQPGSVKLTRKDLRKVQGGQD